MAEREKTGKYTVIISIKASHPGQLMRVLRRTAGITSKDLGPLMGSSGNVSRIESGKIKFPRERIPDFVSLVAPHFPDPDAIRQILEESFDRELELEGLSGEIAKALRPTFTLDQLSVLKEKLAQPENRERLSDFLENL